MEQKDNLLGVVQTLWKWRRPILITSLGAAIGTAIISLFLPNYYKATTTFLAASPDQAMPEMLMNQTTQRSQYYGNGNDIDRLLTIAESSELISFLIDSFNLYEHYRINPEGEKAPFKVREKLLKLYAVEKTKRDAITLSVEDKDRELTARIANAARLKVDQLSQHILKEGQRQAIQTFERDIRLKREELSMLGDTLMKLRQNFGVYNANAQTESLTGQKSEAQSELIRNSARLESLRKAKMPRDTIVMLEALVEGQKQEVENLEGRLDTFNQGIGTINTLERQHAQAGYELNAALERLSKYQTIYQANTPALILVEQAEVPIVKSRPKRSILVIAAGAMAFIFVALAALLFDNYPIDWQAIKNSDKTSKNRKELLEEKS